MTIISLFKYLLQASLCIAAFAVVYKLILSQFTHFSLMRLYLLIGLTISFILPLVEVPMDWTISRSQPLITKSFQLFEEQITNRLHTAPTHQATVVSKPDVIPLIFYGLLFIYILGCIYRLALFIKSLYEIAGLIRKGEKKREYGYRLIFLGNDSTAFSFFHYIFINKSYCDLPADQLRMIKEHEAIHVRHYHTLDVIFVELIGIILWFNPLISYVKNCLKEIHEYTVDEEICANNDKKRNYAQLLLTLASANSGIRLATGFAGERITRRILMMAKPRSSVKHKLMFIILVPLTVTLLLSFSWIKNPKASSKMQNKVSSNQLNLKKYCGVYFPSKRDSIFLKPVEIILKDNKLFVVSVNTTTELHFEADSIFTYNDNSARSIAFDLDSKKKVTGCALLKFVTKEQRYYLVKEGEYSKR